MNGSGIFNLVQERNGVIDFVALIASQNGEASTKIGFVGSKLNDAHLGFTMVCNEALPK